MPGWVALALRLLCKIPLRSPICSLTYTAGLKMPNSVDSDRLPSMRLTCPVIRHGAISAPVYTKEIFMPWDTD